MKTRTLIALLAASSLGTAFAQNTAFTDPVGYFEVTLSGTFTFMSSGTSNAEKYQGVPDSAVGADITDTGAFTAGEFDQGGTYPTHYAEIARTLADHPSEGARIDIDSNTVDVITVLDDPPGSAAAFTGLIDSTASVIVRKHRTISDIFGGAGGHGFGDPIPADLQLDAGASATIADTVALFDNGSGYSAPIFYSASAFGGAWAGVTDAENLPISPGAGMLVTDTNLNSNTIVQDGHVKVTRTLFSLKTGFNLMCASVALDAVVSDFFGAKGGNGFGDPVPADLVLTEGASATSADTVLLFGQAVPQTFDPPVFYSFSAFGGSWSPGDNAIPFTQSFFVEIKSGNPEPTFGIDFFDEDLGESTLP